MNLASYLLCAGLSGPFTFIPSRNQITKCSLVRFRSSLTSVKPRIIWQTCAIPSRLIYCQHQPCSAISFSTVIKKSKNMSPVQDVADSPVVASSTSGIPDTRKEVNTVEVNKPAEMEVEKAPAKLYFVKLTEHASAPTKGSKYAAGYDLKSAYDTVVPKRGSCLVKTDIQVQLPPGTYGRVAPRSGLALKNKIDVLAGVIDEDYRGNIGVILFNHADEDFIVSKGDRIAQLICEKICYPEAVEVESLEESERGAAGFGSTGGVKKMKMDDKEN